MPTLRHPVAGHVRHPTDPGFTPLALLELMRRRGKYQPQEFDRLRLATAIDLAELKKRWLAAFDAADAFVRGRPQRPAACTTPAATVDSSRPRQWMTQT